MVVEFRHDDMRALHQPHLGPRIDADAGGQHLLDPGTAGVDQHACLDGVAGAGGAVLDRDVPDAVDLPDLDRAGAGANLGAAIGGIARSQRDQPRVVDEAVGIFEALGVAPGDQRLADHVAGQIERARRGQQVPAADVIVEEEAEPQQPGRAQAGMVRQNETQRANDMRRDLPEDLALDQRLAHQTKLVILEIAQPAMHELGRPGRRSAGQIIHFTEENRIAPARRIARDAAAINAASNDGEVVNSVQRTLPPATVFALTVLLSDWSRSQPKTKAK